MSTWALVPIRAFAGGKRRLAPVLDAAQRARLCESMAAQVIATLRRSARLSGVAVVTADTAVRAWAAIRATRVIVDSDRGLNAALEQGARELEHHGADTLLVVPADVPTLTGDDLDALLDARADVVIVPASRDGGTNGLRLALPARIRFCFGADSAAAHAAAARAAGASARSVALPSLSRDIDVAEDLASLQGVEWSRRTCDVL